MYFLTTTIDEPGIAELMADTVALINAPLRKQAPFEIVRTEEPIDEVMPGVMVSRFHLVIKGEVSAKGDKQAAAFLGAMNNAAAEIQRLNDGGYIVDHPQSRKLFSR